MPNEPLPEETIDLRVWVRTLWGHRWILAVSVLAGGIAGWAVSASTTSVYVASVRLVAKGGAPDELRAAIDSAEGVLRDSAVARAVIQEAGLDRPPYNFNPQTLGGEAITLGRDATGSAISIDVRLTEGNLAARTANALAAHAVSGVDKDRRLIALRSRVFSIMALRDELPGMLGDLEAEIIGLSVSEREFKSKGAGNTELAHARAAIARRRAKLDHMSAAIALAADVYQRLPRHRGWDEFDVDLRTKLDILNEKFAYGTQYMQAEIEVQPRLMIAAPATAPIRPMSPRVGRNIAVGIASGLILVVVALSLGQMLRAD